MYREEYGCEDLVVLLIRKGSGFIFTETSVTKISR